MIMTKKESKSITFKEFFVPLPTETKNSIIMPLNPNKDLKQYYSIAEVSAMFNLPASLLRYWEKEFPTIKPKKSGNNVRMYTKEDLEEIRLVNDLVKVRNMKLAAARELIQRNRAGAKSSNDLLLRLQTVREQLLAIKQELDGIN